MPEDSVISGVDVISVLGDAVAAAAAGANETSHNGSDSSFWRMFEGEPGEFRILQPIWNLLLSNERVVASPAFPIVISLSMYLLCMIPFTYFDLFGKHWTWLQKYKIRPDRPVTWPQVRRAMLLTLWNHVAYILPVSIAQCVWTPNTVLPTLAPGLWEFLWHQAVAFFIFDAEYYLWHVIHHKVRWLYRTVHSVHHQYSVTSCWVAEYLHPYELFCIGFFTTTAPWFFNTHPLTQWSFLQLSIITSVEDHCGYDFPLLPHRWFPLWGGAVQHDMHHQRPLTNFQPFFNHWDRLFGSYCPGQRAGGYKPKSLSDWEKKPQPVMDMAFGEADEEETTTKQ
jgi:cholesterol 25-hydroxylase